MVLKEPPSAALTVRRAALCTANELPDGSVRKAAQRGFGRRLILAVGVSADFYRRFGESNHEHPPQLVVRGMGPRKVLVLLLQFEGHQLRCVMSLRRPLVQQAFKQLRRGEPLPMLVFDADGDRYAGLECEVLAEDVSVMDADGLPEVVDMQQCRAELSYVALSCLLHAEMPSIVPGDIVQAVDVALVEDGGLRCASR